MKRTPLQRRTPLITRTALAATTPLGRNLPLTAVSVRRVKQNRDRTVYVNALRSAQQGRCARCGHTDRPIHGHERVRRSQGGDLTRPEIAICDPCNSNVADHPQVSCWNGWSVSPKWPHDPLLQLWEARDLHGQIVDFRIYTDDLTDGAA